MLIRDRLAHKRPVFSFEFFPPKNEKGERVLWRSLELLAPLEPDFVSVTYGAGGSTRTRTVELVGRIKHELGIEPLAHLTCVGSTRDELARVVDRLLEQDVHNILALRGDPPRGETEFVHTPGGFRHASELTAWLRERWPELCIGGACYPEVHPEAHADAARDLAHLQAKVEAGADFLVSQLFFDNASFFDFLGRARGVGIEVPILAGIMPVTDVKQIERFTKMIGATIPDLLHDRLRAIASTQDGYDPQEVFWTGVSYAAHQCRELLATQASSPFSRNRSEVAGIHFYTLNRSPATRALFEILELAQPVR